MMQREHWLTTAATVLGLFCATVASAQALRCEDAAGKVSYAQDACPTGTRVVRTIEAQAAPKAEDQTAARARALADAKALEKLQKQQQAEEARTAKSQRAAEARSKERLRTCKRLALRMKQAQDDLQAAPLQKQAEATRRLKKAQENYQMECGTTQ